MTTKRFALLIASLDYREDSTLSKLMAPSQDVLSLKEVLSDPMLGGFNISLLINEKYANVLDTIQTFLEERKSDETALLYFSGHGIKDTDANLYFAMTDTRSNRLLTTAIRAEDINNLIHNCRAKAKILILDTCYSGAFLRGSRVKANTQVTVKEYLDGRGYIVITSSDHLQYAFEKSSETESTISGEGTQSVFTRELVEGIKSGNADRDKDGQVNLDELYDYVIDQFTQKGIFYQTPKKWAFSVTGKIIISNTLEEKERQRQVREKEEKENAERERARLAAEEKERQRLAREKDEKEKSEREKARRPKVDEELLKSAHASDKKKEKISLKDQSDILPINLYKPSVNAKPIPVRGNRFYGILVGSGIFLILCCCFGALWWVDSDPTGARWCIFPFNIITQLFGRVCP